MDTDFDESMDAFKKSPGFSNKKVVPRKRGIAIKKSVKTNKIGKHFVKVAKSGVNSQKQLIDLPSVCSDSGIGEGHENLLSNEVSPNEFSTVITRPCPTCGKSFDLDKLKRHTKACLKANFAACRAASGSNEILRTRPTTPQNLEAADNSEQYLCPTCKSDLSSLSNEQRNTHANRCLDHSLASGSGKKLSPKVKPLKKAAKDKSIGLRCLICAKEVKSKAGLARHYKACQSRNKFTTMTALTLNRPDSGNEVDIEVLAGIRRMEERSNEGTSRKSLVKVVKKKRSRPKMKTVESYNDEMLRLAIGVSTNENLEQKRLKKIKRLPSPAMTSSSPDTKRRELQSRLQEIANSPQVDSDDEDEIPSTPALPTTAMRLPSVRANVRVISGNSGRFVESPANFNNNQAGPSHQNDPLRSQQQVVNIIPANIVMDPNVLQPNINYPNVINVLQPNPILDLPPSPVMEPQSPPRQALLCPGELQSPEVSSSNIKNTSSSDMNESPSMSGTDVSSRQEREVQCDQVLDHRPIERPRTSKWTMTSRNINSSFRVQGLLSQFEPRTIQPLRPQQLPPDDIPGNNEVFNSASASNAEVDEHIDSTLLAMEELDSNQVSQDVGASNSQPQSSQQVATLSREESDSSSNLSQTKPPSFIRLLDQRQFSDAKIFAGEAKEPIYLHRNILFCSCPNLLTEIERVEPNEFWLKEFSKPEIMPLLRFFYAGEISCLTSDGSHAKTKELLQRLGVQLSESDQQIFDNQINEDMLATPLPMSPKMPQLETDEKSIEQSSDDTKDFVVFPTPTDNMNESSEVDDRSFEEDLLPQNLTQEDPKCPESPSTSESPKLDCDEEIPKLSEVGEQSLRSDVDMFDLGTSNNISIEKDNADSEIGGLEDELLLDSKLPTLSEISIHEEDAKSEKLDQKSEEKVDDTDDERDIDSVITQENNGSLETLSQRSLTSNDSQIYSSQDEGASSDIPELTVRKKPRKRKRVLDSPVPAQRKSKRRSLSRGRGRHFWGKGCPCCQDDSDVFKSGKRSKSTHRYQDNRSPAGSPHSSRKSVKISSQKLKSNLLDRAKSTPKLSPMSHKTIAQKFPAHRSPTASPIRVNVKGSPKMSPLRKKIFARKQMSPITGAKAASPNKETLKKLRNISVKSSPIRSHSSTPKKSIKADLNLKRGTQKRGPLTHNTDAVKETPIKRVLKNVTKSEEKVKVTKSLKKAVANNDADANSRSSISLNSHDGSSQKLLLRSAKKTVACKAKIGMAVSRRKSLTKRVRRRSSSRSSKETIYVSERLPRFKQRDHIKSRPGVANMMKNVTKVNKQAKKHENVVPKSEVITNEPAPDNMEGISFSQPVETVPFDDKMEDVFVDDEVPEFTPKKYKFKRVSLLGYVSSSQHDSPKVRTKSETDENDFSDEGGISGYASDGHFTNICFDDSFEADCLKTSEPVSTSMICDPHHAEYTAEPSPVVISHDVGFKTPLPELRSEVVGSKYFGPVPITPMPNFQELETPEVIKQAMKFGLKKTLGKMKLRTKLQEAYLYKHLTASDSEDSDNDNEHEIDVAEMDKNFLGCTENDDDLCIDTSKTDEKLKLDLSRLSMASTSVNKNFDNIYTFKDLSTDEVLALSTKVVDEMFVDGSLLAALKETKKETGSIKRGSRQDQIRCWNIVTPGSSSYNPKLNAILSLSEEYQSAITGPLVSCVVKNYIAYKKYQFDCVPIVCDRMQKEINQSEH